MISEVEECIKRDYNLYLSYLYSINNGKDDPKDILQECILYLYETKDETLNKKLDFFNLYFLNILKKSTQSKTSRYQHSYNRVDFVRIGTMDFEYKEDIYIDKLELCDYVKILDESKCDRFCKEVFIKYINKYKSFGDMHRDTLIPHSTLYSAYKVALDIIKNKLNNG